MNHTVSIKRPKDLEGDNDCETRKKPKTTQDDILVSKQNEVAVAELSTVAKNKCNLLKCLGFRESWNIAISPAPLSESQTAAFVFVRDKS